MMMKASFKCLVIISILLIPPCAWCVQANTVVATINTGVTPAGLAVTPNNNFAYVANNDNYGIANQNSVSVLNLINNTFDLTISSTAFNQPYTVTINSAGTRAYVTNSAGATVTVIDLITNTVIDTISGFDGPSGFAISPIANIAYVNNYGGPIAGSGNGNTVRVVNLDTNSIIGTPIIVDQAPAALAITPNGAFVYVVNYVDGNPGTGTINVINTTDNLVTTTITGFSGPFDIAITPNGQFAYVPNFGSNNFAPFGTTVSVVNLTTNTIVDTITLGIQPSGIAITPDGRYVYATNYNTLYAGAGFTDLTAGQGTVNIIDTATNTVIPPTIAVGQSPDAIAISPDGEFAYVSNYTSNTVNVIALPTFALSGQGCQIKNIFLMQEDLVNKLSWSASGSSLPVSYSLYGDAQLTNLIATVAAGPTLEFFDHNKIPGVVYTYYLVGTNAAGTSSAPLAITVIENC